MNSEVLAAPTKKSFLLQIRFSRFPIAIEFTREGLIFVFLSLAIGAAAVNTGNNVLYLIFSLMLGLIVVSGIVSRRILAGLEAELQFPARVFSGTEDLCYVSITNRKKSIPAIGVRFIVRQEGFPRMSRYFFYIAGKSQVNGFVPVVFQRRGIYKLEEFEIQTRFPFSFFTKIRRFFLAQTVCVYPRIFRFSEGLIARLAEGMIVESPYRGDSQQLLHIRDYTSFDSSKRIHWKASARLEKLLVKEFQKEQGRDLYIYYDCYNAGKDAAEAIESAVSFIASLAYYVTEKNYRAHLVFADRDFDLNQEGLLPVLEYLAELNPVLKSVEAKYPVVPEDRDCFVLQVRSKKIPPVLRLPLTSVKTILVEDTTAFLQEPVLMDTVKRS